MTASISQTGIFSTPKNKQSSGRKCRDCVFLSVSVSLIWRALCVSCVHKHIFIRELVVLLRHFLMMPQMGEGCS